MSCTHALRALLAGAALLLPTVASAQPALSIEKLVDEGWEIAGYVAAFENRTLILFRHKDRKYLVQCSVLTDVMRNPRVVVHCYELR
jgi:hypothetical protein